MPITKELVTKLIDLDLPAGLSPEASKDIKDEVGAFVVVSILDEVGKGISPVNGEPFTELSKPYADEQKGGRRLPNLELEGDMLGALIYVPTPNGVEVGIFDPDQAIKAYGHITGMKDHPFLDGVTPARVFIPGAKGKFTNQIEAGIKKIVNRRIMEEAIGTREARQAPRTTPSDFGTTEEIITRFPTPTVRTRGDITLSRELRRFIRGE